MQLGDLCVDGNTKWKDTFITGNIADCVTFHRKGLPSMSSYMSTIIPKHTLNLLVAGLQKRFDLPEKTL